MNEYSHAKAQLMISVYSLGLETYSGGNKLVDPASLG